MFAYEKFDGENDQDSTEGIEKEEKIDFRAKKAKNKEPDFDHIEVSLEDPEDNAEVINRASDFFVEHNDNFTLSWQEVADKLEADEDDPSNPPKPGWNKEYVLWRLRRIVESIPFRLLTFFLIILDVILVIIDLVENPGGRETFNAYQLVDLIITVWFVIELILRIVALSWRVFFSRWYNVVDFAVVCITFIIAMTALSKSGEWAEKLSILTILRGIRVVRLIRICTERKQIETAARQMVSQNKRRFQQDGHDLDLTYVTKRIIATSFPSTGLTAMYRNPIEKVAKFLNEKHPRKYRIYNLCSERTYDTHHFVGCTVERFMIDDHNVPSLEDMLRFTQSVKEWLKADPEHVIVVHCKGGKGRTGTMICIWLVEAGIFSTATQSLDYFGNRRTDTNISQKFQGVETPSQSRYVGYYEAMMNNGGCLPSPRPITIAQINITGIMYFGEGNGDDLWFNIDVGRANQVFSAHVGFRRNCKANYNPEKDLLTVDLINCPKLDGDVRILFQSSSNTVPKGYEKAPFYFWFNTAFVSDKLVLKREDLDNPHKPKTWHCFRENFSVELSFQSSV